MGVILSNNRIKGDLFLNQSCVSGLVLESMLLMDTRRYAKRQLTWFRNQMKDWPWEAPETAQRALETQLAGV